MKLSMIKLFFFSSFRATFKKKGALEAAGCTEHGFTLRLGTLLLGQPKNGSPITSLELPASRQRLYFSLTSDQMLRF